MNATRRQVTEQVRSLRRWQGGMAYTMVRDTVAAAIKEAQVRLESRHLSLEDIRFVQGTISGWRDILSLISPDEEETSSLLAKLNAVLDQITEEESGPPDDEDAVPSNMGNWPQGGDPEADTDEIEG